jgi:hypothetical protein
MKLNNFFLVKKLTPGTGYMLGTVKNSYSSATLICSANGKPVSDLRFTIKNSKPHEEIKNWF